LTKVGKLSLKFLFYGLKFVFLEKFSTYCLRVLYIYRDLYEKHRAEEHERIKEVQEQHPADLFYMRQFTHNACGTVALIHSVANNKE